MGTWRTDVGQKGGGKGWCGDCLKADKKDQLVEQGLSRDEHYNLYFTCQACNQAVRVRKENKKQRSKGSEHLLNERFCNVCIDLKG